MAVIVFSYVTALILKEGQNERNHQRASKSTRFQIPHLFRKTIYLLY